MAVSGHWERCQTSQLGVSDESPLREGKSPKLCDKKLLFDKLKTQLNGSEDTNVCPSET